MSKHTDTGRAGKKLWILIPVIAVLIIAAALVWLNSVYIYAGGLHRRDSAQIDLRGKSISEERYLRLREQLPDCKIYWDVPIGGAVIDCESTAIVLTSLTEEDVARLAFFPALAELDLTAADVSPERFDAVRAAYPALSVRWSIPIGASRYPSDAESITLTDFTVSELPLFDYFTALRSADARGCACYDALLALREKYPALKLEWQVPLGSTEYLDSTTEIAVDDISITPDALREAIRLEAEAAARLRYLIRTSRACQNAFGEALCRGETRRRALHAEFFLREGERGSQLRSGTAPGVLSALRQIVLLARARVRLYESAKENALPLAPETARRFAAECRAEESAAARLLALSMK